jgi:hypothetical protein
VRGQSRATPAGRALRDKEPAIFITAITTDPCDRCRRLGWDAPWQLVARLRYRGAGEQTARVALCLSRHLAEFLAEQADAQRGAPAEEECPV